MKRKLLLWIIFLVQRWNLHPNNRLKPGDIVQFNWMAKVSIPFAIQSSPPFLTVKEVFYAGSYVEFTNGESSDTFWITEPINAKRNEKP